MTKESAVDAAMSGQAPGDGGGFAESGRSARKHRAIMEAATTVFLRSGYLGTSMDEIAALAEVSKQTVYKHFGSKEQLFVELVTSMTVATGDPVGHERADASTDVAEALRQAQGAWRD
mgnify:CR=1 FL=1